MDQRSGSNRQPFERTTSENTQDNSSKQNDWMSQPHRENLRSQSNNFTRGSQWNSRNYTSFNYPTGSPTSSESSWSSSDMTGMSRWPSAASFISSTSSSSPGSSIASTTPTKDGSYASSSSSCTSISTDSMTSNSTRNSSFYRSPRDIYSSHSIFLDNLRSSGDSDDSFSSEFEQFYCKRK